MGYARYTLPSGREAGYEVEAECDHEGCTNRIDRGCDFECGGDGCENFCCHDHLHLGWTLNGFVCEFCYQLDKIRAEEMEV